jgi:hypothetical protein
VYPECSANIIPFDFVMVLISVWGHALVQLVEVPRYKSEDRGLDSDGVIGIFH